VEELDNEGLVVQLVKEYPTILRDQREDLVIELPVENDLCRV
jgi:hypothetical protein